MIEETNRQKGCVYFFKHVGLDTVKIGYSEHPDPMVRFMEFKVFAPYGAELVGFIPSINPSRLEKVLHKKYAEIRLCGEWFDMTRERALSIIKFHSDLEDVENRNKFQIDWIHKYRTKVKKYADPSYFEYLIVSDPSIIEAVKNANGYTITLKFFGDLLIKEKHSSDSREALRKALINIIGESNGYRWSKKEAIINIDKKIEEYERQKFSEVSILNNN